MNHLKTVLFVSLLFVLFIGCSSEDPTPTPVPPTEAPTDVPATEMPPTEIPATAVPEIASPLDTMDHEADPRLVDINWQWERREDASGTTTIDVENPQDYLIFYNEDGAFNTKMDCNNGNGRYATSGLDLAQSNIFMELQTATMAECGEGSYAEEFSWIFGPAQSYRFEEDGNVLVLIWVAGGGIDYFRNGDIPTSPLVGMEHEPDPRLVNIIWAWERRNDGSGNPTINVENPENYTLFYKEDGTFNTRMDCNNGTGLYATSSLDLPQSNIFMELQTSTMAECGEGSYAEEFSWIFGPAQSYRFEEDGNVLVLIWVAGGGIDYFRNSTIELPEPPEGAATGTVIAPDGVFLRTGPGTEYPAVGAAPFGTTGEIIGISEDGTWWVAYAPNQPGSEVWVAAEYVETENTEDVPVVPAPQMGTVLTGVQWQWAKTITPVSETEVPDPSKYTVLFNKDGTVNIQADCNTAGATYETDGNNITITMGPSTLAACAPESLDQQYLAELSQIVLYFSQNGRLFMEMPADAGTMEFIPQSPISNPEAPSGGAEDHPFYLVAYGPEGNPQPLIEGTQITAVFDNDQVSGSAGCNNYVGTLTPVDDHFTIGPIGTTRKFCQEPVGVMEQENAYLAALESVGGYYWEQQLVNDTTLVTGGQLFYTLPDGGGVGVLNFVTTP